MTRLFLRLTLAAAALLLAGAASAATVTYSSRTLFEAALDRFVVDDYSNPAYLHGDLIDAATYDRFSNAAMSAVFGQTRYTSTGFGTQINVIDSQANPFYCAGCNGSFVLDFTSTDYGDADGVFGVGFEYAGQSFTVFVTYGDGSTQNILPANVTGRPSVFWGLTSDLGIRSIAVGLPDGAPTNQGGAFAIDNLTIGADDAVVVAELPAPGTLPLAAAALLAAGWARRRRR